MSSYIDHYKPRGGHPRHDGAHIVHSWADFTAARLEWLYGPGRADTPQARADVENWNRLGRKVAA